MTHDPKGLGAVFDAHTDAEFKARDIEATMATMGANPHVNHVPVMTGGYGADAVRRFYETWFIGRWPEDATITLVSRTVGETQLVDELILSFTHDCEMPAILPGIKPTGRKVVCPTVVIVGFDQESKITHEHIYWDQATLLGPGDHAGATRTARSAGAAGLRRRAERARARSEPPSEHAHPQALAFGLFAAGLARRGLCRRLARTSGDRQFPPSLEERAPAVEGDARAPAERDPVEPPHFWCDGEIDIEKDQHRRHIGEEVNGEAPGLPVDEDALSPPRLAQEKREGMGGERGAPAERHPGEPERVGGQPEIDRGADQHTRDEGGEVDEEEAHRQIFDHVLEHASGRRCREGSVYENRTMSREFQWRRESSACSPDWGWRAKCSLTVLAKEFDAENTFEGESFDIAVTSKF